jgi:uncharacterized membrane protein
MMDVISNKPFDSHPRSIVKALSWRTVGSIDTFVLSWIVTGNFVWAGSIASFEVFTKMILYYVHERGWSHVKWGLVRSNGSPASRLPSATGISAPVIAASFADSRWAQEDAEPRTAGVFPAVARRR